MNCRRYTSQEVVEKTREAIHMFARKQMDSFVKLLDNNFVWIGDYEPLYMRGISAFSESVQEESQELPVEITNEEYALLSHERHMWVTYGRFTATCYGLAARIHFTFVWQQKGNNLLLIHANANHAQKMPQSTAKSKIFESFPQEIRQSYRADTKKLTFRDQNGSIRYLFAEEIRFMKATNKVCEIFTQVDFFSSRITLKEMATPPFFQIHRAYLVNLSYLREIRRYCAILLDGTELPIGKELYMDLKQHLQKIGTAK